MTDSPSLRALDAADPFPRRHLGPDAAEVEEMLSAIGFDSIASLMDAAVPAGIRTDEARALLNALFPKQQSSVWPVG